MARLLGALAGAALLTLDVRAIIEAAPIYSEDLLMALTVVAPLGLGALIGVMSARSRIAAALVGILGATALAMLVVREPPFEGATVALLALIPAGGAYAAAAAFLSRPRRSQATRLIGATLLVSAALPIVLMAGALAWILDPAVSVT